MVPIALKTCEVVPLSGISVPAKVVEVGQLEAKLVEFVVAPKCQTKFNC